MSPTQLLFNFLFLMAVLTPIQATQYLAHNNATSTPGGTRFNNEITIPYSEQILQLASKFILKIFNESDEQSRKSVAQITMIVESLDGVAYTEDDSIHVSSEYIANYVGDVRTEIIGVLYHETTHIWQWGGKGETPGGLIEGVADYVRLKSGWAPAHWVKRGTGKRWDEGYAVTAYFLEYCNGIKDGFVGEINGLMKDGYSDEYFVQILGKNVDDLWNDYKANYGGS